MPADIGWDVRSKEAPVFEKLINERKKKMVKYKTDDWLRLKGQSDRECVHIIVSREVKSSEGTQYWYEVRLVVFDSYNNLGSRSLFIINEIEIADKIEEPKPK